MSDFQKAMIETRNIEKVARFGLLKLVQEMITVHGIHPTFDALSAAVEEGHTELVEYFLSECKMDPSSDNQSLVIMASEKKHTGILHLFLNDKRVDTVILFFRSVEKGNTEIIKFLLSNRIITDPSQKAKEFFGHYGKYGRGIDNDALLIAAENGYKDIVEILLKSEFLRREGFLYIWNESYQHEPIARILYPYVQDEITDERLHYNISGLIRRVTASQSCVDFLLEKLSVPIDIDSAEFIISNGCYNLFDYDTWTGRDKRFTWRHFKYFLRRIPGLLGEIFDRYMDKLKEGFEECAIEELIDNGLLLTTNRLNACIKNLRLFRSGWREINDGHCRVLIKFVKDLNVDPTYDNHFLFFKAVYNIEDKDQILNLLTCLLKRRPYSEMASEFRARIDLHKVQPRSILALARAKCFPLEMLMKYSDKTTLKSLLKFPALYRWREKHPDIWGEIILEEQETLETLQHLKERMTQKKYPDFMFRQVIELLPEIYENTSIEGTRDEVLNRWMKLISI